MLNLSQEDSRIHGNCLTCTVTGRISMQEPNLQNVPKDFRFEDNNLVVSVRKAFVPALGNVMLSADYCQLELRLLTHFSQDSILCEIMKQQGDIFKSIAAKWNNVTEEEVFNDDRLYSARKSAAFLLISYILLDYLYIIYFVSLLLLLRNIAPWKTTNTDQNRNQSYSVFPEVDIYLYYLCIFSFSKQVTNEIRQHTKQLCYGMIYGMGVKSLAENLCISETEAQKFLESFMSAYPGIYKWLDDTLEKAHHDGYVTTLLGRRRQLPDLKSEKSSTRGDLIATH